jgi:hypothetical protein
MLNETVTRINDLLATLERLAFVGFQNGTEPARAVSEVSKLRTEFALIVPLAAKFNAVQLIEFEADLGCVVDKLERGITSLLEPQPAKA